MNEIYKNIIEKQDELIEELLTTITSIDGFFSASHLVKIGKMREELSSLKAEADEDDLGKDIVGWIKEDNRYYDAMKFLADWNKVPVSEIDAAILNYIQGKLKAEAEAEKEVRNDFEIK